MTRRGDKTVVSGYLNQKIDIWAQDNIPSEFGGSFPNSEVYWSTSAKVSHAKSFRRNEGGVSDVELYYTFQVRYRNDKNIQNDMILKWRGCWFVIFGYNPDVVYQEYVLFNAVQRNPGDLVST